MAAEINVHRSSPIKSVIPRSRSDFNYVNLTPKEKRRTTDFSHLLPHFSKDPPYARLLDTKVPIIDQPKSSSAVVPSPPSSRMCRSVTGAHVRKSPTLDVIRSHSMRSLRRSLEMSPTRPKIDESKDDAASVGSDLNRTPNLPEDKDYRRLRNFSMTSKGLVNWGDSFRSISMPFVPDDQESSSTELQMTPSSSGLDSGQAMSQVTPSVSFTSYSNKQPPRYRIVILGSPNVGKTTMIKQFKTSEYICAYDSSCSDENTDFAITVILNGEESELEFIDSCSLEDETDDEGCERGLQAKPYIVSADGYLVVYSVTSRRSFLHGLRLVSRVQNSFLHSPVWLVGNKSDLVRTRAVTTDEARNSAKELNCEFMETSVAINHQVDELLVTILTAIRNKTQYTIAASATYSPSQCSLSRAKGIIKNFLKKACFQSKSCDNLQRL